MLDRSNARIILLTAPAGYGKTTLAQQWLAGRPNAWYRGTHASADVAALALGIALAAAEIVPGADDRLRERLRATNHPEEEVDVLAELLAEDLAAWPAEAWLAIDDYQFAMEADAPERFVERLVELAPLRLFVTSRFRPSWAAARRILYGEFFELERDALAMSDKEAREVLTDREHVPMLVERAQGWPAVIGLAALTDSITFPKDDLPAALYDYFAEEVYLQAEPAVRWGLCQLAIAPTITVELAQHLFGMEAGTLILDHGIRLGVFSGDRPGTLSLHPLLRTFLDSKLAEYGSHAVMNAVDLVNAYLVERRQWDETFDVIQRAGDGIALPDLVEAGLDEMLEEGRLSTLERWISYGRTEGIQSAVLDLAEAEGEFRRGAHLKAQTLATRAASSFGPDHRLFARAMNRAARSAFMNGREDLALTLHQRAQRAASGDEEEVEAVLGQLFAALDLEADEIDRIGEELGKYESQSPKAAVRVATSKVIVASRRGGLLEALHRASSTLELVPLVSDPLTRSAFLHVLSYGEGIAARYSRAVNLATQALNEAETYRLDFALRHAYVTKAIGEIGLRRYAAAESLLNRAERISRETRDAHVEHLVHAVRIRMEVARGSPFRSSSRVQPRSTDQVTKPMIGELTATMALSEACGGRLEQALRLASQAEKLSVSIETRIPVMWARTIVEAAREQADAEIFASKAFQHTLQAGCRDCFVCAYRGYPHLLSLLVPDRSLLPELLEILSEAQDLDFARRTGLDVPTSNCTGESVLTKREVEVLELLQEGLSNREIAEKLVISEATAKLHVRHILGKLGVRSRTEAALKGPMTR
jgi:LuxR family maltose regulon positive regulatory protein